MRHAVLAVCGVIALCTGILAQEPVRVASAPPQRNAARATIDGVVTDTSLAPIAGATALIVGSGVEVVTNDRGRFRIAGLPAGTYPLTIRRLGYAPLSTVVTLDGGDTVRALYALVPANASLKQVVVHGMAAVPRLMEFEQRRALGRGQFMTETDIRKLNFAGTSDLLRTFRSVVVGRTAVLNSRDLPIRNCPMQFFVDGVAIVPGDLDVHLPSPGELAGIEVYASSATVPVQYATLGVAGGGSGGMCGVILLWTK